MSKPNAGEQHYPARVTRLLLTQRIADRAAVAPVSVHIMGPSSTSDAYAGPVPGSNTISTESKITEARAIGEAIPTCTYIKKTCRTAARPISVTKVFFDVIIASISLLFLAPLLALVALLIRIDSPGPVLFRQTRTGLNGKQFQIYKFRTMVVQENGEIVHQVMRDDARVTRIGSLLRKMSIDELPQLLNVLKWEMSLVGPRPHALAHDKYYAQRIPDYRERFAVRPGITGWAQVNGARGATLRLADMERRIELDIWYIQNVSLLLDFRILLRTVVMELMRQTDAF